MKRNAPRYATLLNLSLTFVLFCLPVLASAFGGEEFADAKCSDCHKMTVTEASEILKDIVTDVHGVDLSEVPGLYIVDATGKNGKRGLLYMDFSRSYVVAGNFMSIADKRNVTKSEVYKLRRVDLTTIPLTDSVIVGNPKASKKVLLFTDPQCPYCEKLHPELDKVVKKDPDVVFFIKMMPLASIHPDSPRIAKAILCEGSTRLLEDSFAGKKIPDPQCQSDAVERTLKLAQDLGIGSTPTLILPDGRIIPGYRPAEDILKLLNGEE